MGRKKRRSSKFKDSSTVIDIEQAREERRQRQEKRHREKQAREEKEERKRQRKGQTRSGRPVSEIRQSERNSFSEEQHEGPSGDRQNRRKMALRRRQAQRRLIAVAAALFILVVLGYSVGNILVLKHDLHTAKKQQVQYEEEKAQLQKDLKEIDDLQNLEEQARDQMRLIKPGETLYIFPENMTNQ